MSRGRIERVLLADWRQLAEGISNLPSDTAIAFSTDKCKKGAREADLKDPIGEGQAAILEFVQWWWIDQWDSKLHEDGSLDDLLKGHPIDEIVFEKILSRLEEWTKQKNEQVATRLLSR